MNRIVKLCSVFFFQAEDGIRDKLVTGVQTCALPISWARGGCWPAARAARPRACGTPRRACPTGRTASRRAASTPRSEEHTSELQSLAYLVCRLLLEKKKTKLHSPLPIRASGRTATWA